MILENSATFPPASPRRIASRPGTGPRGFTLIEMMVVVAIIVILAGLTIVVGVQVKRYSQEKATNLTLSILAHDMSDYLTKGNAEPAMNAAFAGNPTGGTAPTTGWQTDLLLYDTTLQSQPTSSTGVIVDAYGNPIQYIPTGWVATVSGTTVKFVASVGAPGHFVSYGPDGKFEPTGTSEDLISPDVNYKTQ